MKNQTLKRLIQLIMASLNSKSDKNHVHTKSDIGLSNVDNTSDINKPISTATQEALNNQLDVLKQYINDIDLNSMGAFPTLKLADPNDPDLDHYIYSGLWYFTDDGTEWLHMPDGCKDGYLLVLRINAAHNKQIFFRAGTKNVNSFQQYERSYTFVGADVYQWTDWVRNLSKRDPEGMMLSAKRNWIDYESTVSPSWVRFAKINWLNGSTSSNDDLVAGAPFSCIISIKRTYNSAGNEEHMIRLDSAYQSQWLSPMYSRCMSGSHLVRQIRIVRDTENMQVYLDMYYQHTSNNPFYISIIDGISDGAYWEVLDKFIPVAETEDNIVVMATRPLLPSFNLSTDILDSKSGMITNLAYSKPGLDASELPAGWLAAWNAHELRAIHWATLKQIMGLNNVNNTADTAKNVNAAVMLKGWSDTRSTANVPNDYNGSFKVMGIKTKTGLVGSGTAPDDSAYFTTAGIRGHNDSSGGFAHELIFSGGATEIYHRAGSTTSWNSIRRIAHIDNIPTKLSQLTNDLTIVTNSDKLDGYHATAFGQQFHYSTRESLSGYYKIKIKSTTSWMVSFVINLYQTYEVTMLLISGYNYGSSHWYSPRARIIDSTLESIDVKFGYDGVGSLWVAVPAAQYTGLTITNVNNGYTQVDDWANGFTVENMATLTGTVQSTITAYRPLKKNETATKASKIATQVATANTNRWVYFADGSATTSDGVLNVVDKFKYNPVTNALTVGSITGSAASLQSNAGSATQPVYFSGGKPVACSYTLGKSVPADAKFTDTNTTYSAATQSASGLMSAADKKKLDGIASGANAYSHPSTHAATMITTDATHRFVTDTWTASVLLKSGGTMTGALSMNGQQINLASDAYMFAGANIFIGSSRSNAVVQTRSAGGIAALNASGSAYVHVLASAFTVSSSRRFKENIVDMDDEYAKKILDLRVVHFDYIGEETPNDCDGMIAEEVEEVIPFPVEYQGDEIIGLDYSKFVPALIKMVQMQQKEINQLKSEKEDVLARLEKLESLLIK